MCFRTIHVSLLLIASALAWAGEEAAGVTVIHEYEWLTNGEKSGALELTISPAERTRTARFEFNDRGRGPNLTEVTRFSEPGQVVNLQISGSSYMGAPVDESFQRHAATAEWHSTSESGSSDDSSAFYLANDGTPEQQAQLARALLAAPDGRLDLLPNGSARISKLDEIEKANAGIVQTLSLYSIVGIGLDPVFIWLDQNNELFGLAGGSAALVPKGWASLAPELQEHQDRAELAFHRSRAEPLTHQLPSKYAITNVNVVEVETGDLLNNRVVVVADGKIQAISELAPTDDGVLLIDAQGGTLIPGLWDMHTHISVEQGLLHVAGGVTTIRDMGNNPENYRAVKAAFDSGEIIGPRTFAAGVIERRSPYSAPLKALAETLPEALALVDVYAAMGYPQIKIYSSVEPGWVAPLAERAHAQGMRVSGHIPSFMTAERAINDGFDEIQHINMLFLNFLAGPQDDTRTPLRFTRVAEAGGGLDLESEPVRQFIELLKSRQVVVDPTVAIFDDMFRHRSGNLSPSFAMVAEHFPPAMKRGMYAGRMDINKDNADTYAASADALLGMLRKLHESGVHIVAGTDSLAGFGLHRELELYVQAGIPTADTLRLATLGAAELMQASDTSGSIAPGKNADFVLLASNPLADISALRTARMVFKGDRYFIPTEMYRAVGISTSDGNNQGRLTLQEPALL